MTKQRFCSDVLSQVGRKATVTIIVTYCNWNYSVMLRSSKRSFRSPATRTGWIRDKWIDSARTREAAIKKARKYLKWAKEAGRVQETCS